MDFASRSLYRPAGCVLLAGWLLVPGSQAVAGEPVTVEFRKEVTNLEFLSVELMEDRPPQLLAAHDPGGELLYGLLPRRQPSDDINHKDRFVPFMVHVEDGIVARAWVDGDLDGRLSEDSRVPLSAYPSPEGARSFLVDLRWNARPEKKDIPVSAMIRVVLEPRSALEQHMIYRLQAVHSMKGSIRMEGREHRAILHDGNHDGIYSQDFGDGLFIDTNDDRHFDVDYMSPEFGSMSVPFRMGRGRYAVRSVRPDGSMISLEEELGYPVYEQVRTGSLVPEFTLVDMEGKAHRLSDYRGDVVLVYFWASWCGTCAVQAEPMRVIHERYAGRGLRILGVSYDTDGGAVKAFREANHLRWPTSFDGRRYWENEIGRLFGADGSGGAYLIDRSGILQGVFVRMEELDAELESMLGDKGPSSERAAKSGS